MFHLRLLTLFVAGISLMAMPANGQYEVLVDFDDIRVGPQYNILGSHLEQGNTLFAIVRGIESDITDEWESQITKVENFNGTPVTTELVSNAEWKAFTGGDEADTILPGNRMMIAGNSLQFLDANTDIIYRIDVDTGAISEYVTPADIEAVTGTANATLIDAVAISPDGEMVFYEQASDHLLLVRDGVSGPEIEIFIDAADLVTLYGSSPVNLVAGGMTFDCEGNFYWTLSNTGSTGSAGGCIYKMDAIDGTLSQIIHETDIQLVTFIFANVGFNDLYAAPDGNIYFYDRGSDGILYFDPIDPVASLTIYLTESDLVSGPAGTDYVGHFFTRGPYLVWNNFVKQSPDLYQNLLAEIPGDFDLDGDVDLVDYAAFADCLAGPDMDPAPTNATMEECLDAFDSDCDADVDLKDFTQFAESFGALNNG